MALRWAAVALVETEKHYRRIMGYRDLWMLKAHLDGIDQATPMDTEGKLGSHPGGHPTFNYERECAGLNEDGLQVKVPSG